MARQSTSDPGTWLREQLRGQPRLERRLLERAARQGFTATDMRAAAIAIGVEVGTPGPLRFWRLPVAAQH